jgi:hypothetical protein
MVSLSLHFQQARNNRRGHQFIDPPIDNLCDMTGRFSQNEIQLNGLYASEIGLSMPSRLVNAHLKAVLPFVASVKRRFGNDQSARNVNGLRIDQADPDLVVSEPNATIEQHCLSPSHSTNLIDIQIYLNPILNPELFARIAHRYSYRCSIAVPAHFLADKTILTLS